MKTETKIAITIGCVTALVAFAGYQIHAVISNAEQRGAAKAVTAQLDSNNAALRGRAARVDTVHVRDSVRYVVTRARYDTLRITDTLRIHDTLYVRKELADASLKACSDVFLSCEHKVAVRDSIIANRDARIVQDERLASLARHQSTRDKIVWGILGAASGRLSCAVR